MGAILGLGVTHVPLLAGRDENMTRIVRRVLADPDLPERYRRPDGWPEAMRQEWGSDEGLAAARRHRQALVTWFARARRVLDDFAPDFVVVWGDDQYENFKEDIIPPFCVLAYDSIEHRPWEHAPWANAWDEPKETTFVFKGQRPAAKALVSGLLGEGFDVSYAYRPLHHPLGHAFMNTLLFLDYERQGFPYPVIPLQVNSHAEAPSALPGHRLRPRDVRDVARGRLPGVAANAARADGGLRPAGDAELDVPRRRDGGARPPAGRDGLHPELHLQLQQSLRGLQAVTNED